MGLKIAVNTRLLLRGKLEGIGWFTYEVFKRMAQNHPEDEFIFFFDRPYSDEFVFAENVKPVVLFPQARHPFLFYWWFERSVKKALDAYRPDVFVSPDGFLSLGTEVPQLAVMHDLNFEHYPEDLPFLVSKYYRYFFPRFAKKAKRLLTVSSFSRQDMMKQYDLEMEKIDVAYNGKNDLYRPLSLQEKKEVREEWSEGEEYFVYVGSLHKRKNIERLLKAFDWFKEGSHLSHKLILVGGKMFKGSEIESMHRDLPFREDIIFTGHLPQEQLAKVMGAAQALVYVSYFEGFGIPLVEAMACEVPVITSNVSALPEVARDAALLVDPFSEKAIARAMMDISSSEELRRDLIEKGNKRMGDFSWDKTSEEVYQSILKTLD